MYIYTDTVTFYLSLCRYAYETGDDFDEEVVRLAGSGIKVSGDMSILLERKASGPTEHHVFGLGEEREEDKRE